MVPAEASFSVLAQALVVSALTLVVQIYLYELSSFCLEFRLRNRDDFQILASLSITEWFMSFMMSDEHSFSIGFGGWIRVSSALPGRFRLLVCAIGCRSPDGFSWLFFGL